MRLSLFLVSLLCAVGMFSVGRWLFPSKRRRSRSAVPLEPVQRGRQLPATGHKLLLNKQGALPPGFDREFQAGLYPLSQVIAAAFETIPSSAGLYAVTFSPKTLEALRTGHVHLMHSVGGDRAIAVELNGRIAGIGTITEPGFDALRACFATASLLTGQYFLARIDTKLNAIFSSVQDILRMLDSAERAKLNLATTYLKFLITAVRQGRFFEQDEAEIRSHRMECLLIAERNLIEIEDRMAPSESRESLGVKERIGEFMDSTTNWVSNKASVLKPSVEEDGLLNETKVFAKEMSRGIIALQTSLCFEAILQPPEAHSPSGMQLLSIKERFRTVKETFERQFKENKEIALKDWRYVEAEEKRQRLDQELNASLARVNTQWDVLEELEAQWKHRAASVPETVYVEVNDAGQPQRLFLPEPWFAKPSSPTDGG